MNIMAYGLIKGCGYTQIKHNDFKADWKNQHFFSALFAMKLSHRMPFRACSINIWTI